MTPEQMMNWFTYQYALVLSGHRILLEPLLSPAAATAVRAAGPEPGADAALHEIYITGPLVRRAQGPHTVLSCEVDDRSFREEFGEVVQTVDRCLVSVETTLRCDRILSATVEPR